MADAASIAVLVVFIVAVSVIGAMTSWSKTQLKQIYDGYEMACLELYARAEWLLQGRFTGEELGEVAAAVTNIASASSLPETSKFEHIRARAADIYGLEHEMVAADEPFRELAVRTQRMKLIESNIRNGFRPWGGKKSKAGVAAALQECWWFMHDGSLGAYGGQYPEEPHPKQFKAFVYQFWQQHQAERLPSRQR